MNNFYNRRLGDKSPAFLHYFTGSLYSLAGSRSLTFLLYGDFFIQKKKKSSVMNFGTARFHFIIFSQGLHVLTLKISIQPKNQAHFSYFQVSKISWDYPFNNWFFFKSKCLLPISVANCRCGCQTFFSPPECNEGDQAWAGARTSKNLR